MFQKNLFADIRAGVVVFLVALPLCLGIAMACGVPVFSGIIAGVVGGILVTTFSGSKYSVTGPAAGLTAIVISAISQLGSIEAFLAAVVFAGILQILLGIIKAGTIGNFVPNAVIKGMLAGIGIILIIKQIPHFFGYDKDPEGDFEFFQADGHNSFSELLYMLNGITPGSLIIGILSFALLIIADKPFYKNNKVLAAIPAPLLVVLLGILLTVSFSTNTFLMVDSQHLVNLPTIRNVSDFTGSLLFPDFSAMNTSAFWIIAATLGIVASLETLLNIEATEKLDPEKNVANTNKELMAQGLGNIAAGLIGGLPVTSVIVRSSANINAGAKSRLSTVIHALLLLLCVILIPQVLSLIPNASLAAILIATGYKLTKLAIFKEHFEYGPEQYLPFFITIIVMLLTDLLKGVGVGIFIGVIFIIKDNIKGLFDITDDVINGEKYYIIRLPQHVTFFNKGYLIKFFDSVHTNSKVVIDGSINKKINQDAKDVIEEFLERAERKNIKVQLVKFTL